MRTTDLHLGTIWDDLGDIFHKAGSGQPVAQVGITIDITNALVLAGAVALGTWIGNKLSK